VIACVTSSVASQTGAECARAAHRYIPSMVALQVGFGAAGPVRVLRGGSMKPDNIKGIMAQAEVDGVLAGGG